MNENKTFLLSFLAFALCPLTVIFSQNILESRRYDVVISEIMAKPAPVVGLPEVEYIELHNRRQSKCVLHDWKLKVGNSLKTLPDAEIDSLGFAVVVAGKNLGLMQPLCNNIIPLSSLAITDGGQSITLYNADGEVVHHVAFKISWHAESLKQEGGWSLEMVDTDKPNAGKDNWKSSIAPAGGTPGGKNSVSGVIHDYTPPEIEALTMPDSVTLRVRFSESVSLPSGTDDLFKVSPELEIVAVSEVPPDFSSLDVVFAVPPQSRRVYTLSVTGTVSDCAGNIARDGEERQFGVVSMPRRNALLVSELLASSFNGSDADYLEIYNNTNEIFDLKDLKVGYGGDTIPKKAVTAVPKGFQLLPGRYVALCKDRERTLEQYFCKNPGAVVQCDSLPNFAMSGGVVFLTDRSLQTVDKLQYDESMHYPKLLKTNGVALERLSFSRPTHDASNWFSAAETAGYGTPGYENSQMSRTDLSADFGVSSEVFSPDNDGFEDYLEIFCNFPDEGERLSVTIFSDIGHFVRHVAENVLCGKENVFLWDGLDDKGNQMPAGFYIVQFESWRLGGGKALRGRKAVAIYR